MNKALWVYSLWVGLLCAVFFQVYSYTGLSMGWMGFVALALYYGTGSKPKDIVALLCSMAAGLVWGKIGFALTGFLIGSLGMGHATAVFACVTLVTTAVMGTHLTFLSKTPLNKVPIVFAALALIFSQGGVNPVGIFGTLVGGFVLAVCCSLGERFIFPRFAKAPQSEN
jgi:hypothetical protein